MKSCACVRETLRFNGSGMVVAVDHEPKWSLDEQRLWKRETVTCADHKMRRSS